MRRMTCSSAGRVRCWVGGESGGVDRVLEPGEKLAVEAAVERLGVQGVQPGVQQAVKIAGPAVAGDPAQAVGQGELRQEVQMGAVGVGGVDFPHQRNAAHNIAVGVVAVGAAMDKGQGDPVVGGAEKRHGGGRESLVQFPRKGGVVAAGVIAAGKLHGDKQETAGVAGVKAVGGVGGGLVGGGEQGMLRFLGDGAGDFAVGELKEDLDRRMRRRRRRARSGRRARGRETLAGSWGRRAGGRAKPRSLR